MGYSEGPFSDSKASACNAENTGLIPGSGRSPEEGIDHPLSVFLGFPGGSVSKEPTCNAGDPGSIPGSGRSPEEGTGYHLIGLPWWLRWQTICLQCGRPGFNPWVGKIPWRRTWQPTPVFLPGESPWAEKPGKLQSVGSQRVEHD